ncbi:hypothetical protein BSZ19_18600 [Bradyrhizobium japonicum]|uniref:Uncharacterized protein n=2 Tax=Bradyrhizobium japonicum TaxID=375 RepID=A0A1Y2JNR3_BRAJP|nr:hypothetical protein BSZ19_18600 [Bradyrhizobium japonicum]
MTKLRRSLTKDDLSRIAEMDAACGTLFQRDADRPDNVFVKPRRRQPIEVSRAQQRMRTARWRSEMDRRKAPTAAEVGMALATALATTDWSDTLTSLDYDLIRRALSDLEARGFSNVEARRTMRRLRDRMVDPVDRPDEVTEPYDNKRKLPF